MDLDTIISIVVMVIFLISSIVGKKKPKPLPPQEAETEDVSYTLNEFEKILERKEEFANAQTKQQNDTEVVQEAYRTSYDETNEEIEEKKEEPIIQQKKETESKADTFKATEETKTEDDDEADDGFDLNSAIIYSSILERKKFRH